MRSDYRYVDTSKGVREVVERLSSQPRVALDTEGNSLYNYFERVCLLQLSIGDEHYLIDPLCGVDLSDLYRALADCPLILHAADNDLRMLYAEACFAPRSELFDTLIGAQLLGSSQLSLAALVENTAGVTLSKKVQKSNWARRPLSAEQLEYAVDDTKYLPRIADEQAAELKRLNRLDWHREWCQRSAECGAKSNGKDMDEAWRIRGSGKLRRKELVYLRELWRWRDAEARGVDRPPFKIMGNDELMRLAVWAAEHDGQGLRKGPRLPHHCKGPRLDALKGALATARALPREEWPLPRPRVMHGPPLPSFQEDVDKLRAVSRRIGEGLGLDPSIVAPRSSLEAIARSRPESVEALAECSGLMQWQVGLVRDDVLALFNGKATGHG